MGFYGFSWVFLFWAQKFAFPGPPFAKATARLVGPDSSDSWQTVLKNIFEVRKGSERLGKTGKNEAEAKGGAFRNEDKDEEDADYDYEDDGWTSPPASVRRNNVKKH